MENDLPSTNNTVTSKETSILQLPENDSIEPIPQSVLGEIDASRTHISDADAGPEVHPVFNSQSMPEALPRTQPNSSKGNQVKNQ